MTSHEDFIKTLKVGDKVAADTHDLGSAPYGRDFGPEIWVVTNITPSRARFDLTNIRGMAMSCGRGGDKHLYSIKELTQEVIDQIQSDEKYVRLAQAMSKLESFFYDFHRHVDRRYLLREPGLQAYTDAMEQLGENLYEALKTARETREKRMGL